jgi:hypothetical protein
MNPLALLTRGILHNSRITNGFIEYEIVTKRRRKRGGGGSQWTDYKDLKKDYNKLRNEAECINVTLKWADRPKKYGDKKIYVEFVKSQITADLMLNEDVKINVELTD